LILPRWMRFKSCLLVSSFLLSSNDCI
jgi:hypothetical protein